jgi:hypothetical protein
MKRLWFLGALAVLTLAACAEDELESWSRLKCQVDNDCETGAFCIDKLCVTGSEKDTLYVVDTEQDSEKDVKNQNIDHWEGTPCDDYDPDPKVYDYGDDYPIGPYGFKGSLCWTESADQENPGETVWSYSWGGGGDTLHNMCLPNQVDRQVCMESLVGGEKDILVLVFSAVWCTACNDVAYNAKKFMDDLREAGWNPIMLTVLVQNQSGRMATVADARAWKDAYGLEDDVLHDPGWEWSDLAVSDRWANQPMFGQIAFPWLIFVDTSTMRVWDIGGWPETSSYYLWLKATLNLFSYCKEQSVQ